MTPDAESGYVLLQLPRAVMLTGASMVFVSKGEPFVVQQKAEDLLAAIDRGEPWIRTTIAGVDWLTYVRASEVLAITSIEPGS